MPNALKTFDPMKPTPTQLRDMTRILTFSRMTTRKPYRLTLFGLSMFLRLSSSRVKSLVDGMAAAGILTNDNGRLTPAPCANLRPPFAVPHKPKPAPFK